jgi:hypothetical protein
MNGQLKWWLTTGTTANAAKSQDRGKAPEPPRRGAISPEMTS